MASSKSKTKVKPRAAASAGTKASSASKEPLFLRQRTERRTERRFAPSSNPTALVSVVLTSGGAILFGAGVFGQFLRAAGPHPWGLGLLGAGALVFVVGLLLGGRSVPTIRVGDAGVAVERGEQLERLAWHEIDAVRLAAGTLVLSGAGKVVSIPVGAHPAAAAVALAEARERIPARAAQVTDELPAPSASAGEVLVLEPPQLAGLRCASSDRLVSFEADARLCGRCGQTYHKEEIPEHCVSCDARLRA